MQQLAERHRLVLVLYALWPHTRQGVLRLRKHGQKAHATHSALLTVHGADVWQLAAG